MARNYSEAAEVFRGVVSWNDPTGGFHIYYYGPYTTAKAAKTQCTREILCYQRSDERAMGLGKMQHYYNLTGWVEVSPLNWAIA